MITGEIKNKIDRIWEMFWTGGIANPLTVIEQLTYLIFIKRLDDIYSVQLKQASFTGEEIKNPIFPSKDDERRWSIFKDQDPETMLDTVQNKVFPFIKKLNPDESSAFAKQMKDAIFMVSRSSLLARVVDEVDHLPLEDRDSKGDIYEYLLSKIQTSGTNGQFRTPRHIIKMMVDLMEPKPDDTICDPACGTCGFLVGANEYVREHHPDLFHDKEQLEHFHNSMFYGNDFDTTMIRIGTMNMMLHGVENPNISSDDAISELSAHVNNKFSLILANPPFKGSVDRDSIANDLKQFINTTKTELLFIALFMRLLKTGGRCAAIVPDGVVSNSSNAHVKVRKELVEKQKLIAVISLPSGVFKPYSGVSTSILIFTKTNSGGTDNVWFYDMKADGYSLTDQRTELDSTKHENNNIPDIITRFHNLEGDSNRKRTDQSFLVPKEEIVEQGYDLSINRYKATIYKTVEYEKPKKIIETLEAIEKEILNGLDNLKKVIK